MKFNNRPYFFWSITNLLSLTFKNCVYNTSMVQQPQRFSSDAQLSTTLWVDVRFARQVGNHAWCWKASRRPRARKVMNPGGESTTTTLLNHHQPSLYPKYLSLYPQRSEAPTPVQETSLCNRHWPLQKNHTNQDVELWNPVTVDTSTARLLHLRLRTHFWRGQ